MAARLFNPREPGARARLQHWRRRGLVGIDEAGRGPLAGPVCAAAVVLPAGFDRAFARDSKKLSAATRTAAAAQIEASAIALGVGWANVAEIDEHNVLNATFMAMRRALAELLESQRHSGADDGVGQVLIDGNRLPPLQGLAVDAAAVIKGDDLVAEIGAASILAKVARDRYMERLDECYPGYQFGRHKGYGTRVHLEALGRQGPCAEHRLSFAPVRAAARAAAQLTR